MASQKDLTIGAAAKDIRKRDLFKAGLISGLGWAIGVTVGFVLISTILVVILRGAGGLPLIGDFIADIVEATQEQLLRRSVFTSPETL